MKIILCQNCIKSELVMRHLCKIVLFLLLIAVSIAQALWHLLVHLHCFFFACYLLRISLFLSFLIHFGSFQCTAFVLFFSSTLFPFYSSTKISSQKGIVKEPAILFLQFSTQQTETNEKTHALAAINILRSRMSILHNSSSLLTLAMFYFFILAFSMLLNAQRIKIFYYLETDLDCKIDIAQMCLCKFCLCKHHALAFTFTNRTLGWLCLFKFYSTATEINY